MLENAKVLKVQQENPLIVTIRFRAPKIAAAARPGQFIMLKVSESYDPLLRRPFSIMELDKEKGEIMILFKVIGLGTVGLLNLKQGDDVNIMGPLGNGFDTSVDLGEDYIHLLAGGTGIAPIYPLAQELINQGKKVRVLLGVASQPDIIHADELAFMGCSVMIATMDGSFGCPGSVMLLMQREIERGHMKYIYACGSNGLMQSVNALAAAESIDGQLCLEARMACGVGACKVCSCALAAAEGKRATVCKDGPVFRVGEVEIDG